MNVQLCSALKNERGYMAVFIALIFQVLFVFFAMVINIGLLIHDKINLQNSVDLAAYYAAGKQAEVLDAIAHTNYQIRQSWKLLAWRIRVLGDMAAKGHPMLSPPSPNFNPKNPLDTKINDEYPVICTKHSWWDDAGREEDFCQNKIGSSGVKFPNPTAIIPGIVTVLPINVLLNQVMEQLQSHFNDSCRSIGLQNFKMATRWMTAYRGDIANRARIIEQYAQSLSVRADNFTDIEGESVFDGAAKTLSKNLTSSNRENLEVKLFNALGGQQQWLRKIPVRPKVYYLDPELQGNSCVVQAKECSSPPRYDTNNITTQLATICSGPQSTQDPLFSTVGYEKNPWIMAYVGIEATVKGRRPFAPFGGTVTLTAKAFAKPFGGRVGPWFRSEWQRGSPQSDSGGYVDKMLPFAVAPGGGAAPTNQDINTSVPNYSRYPNDEIGLRSQLTLSMLRTSFLSTITALATSGGAKKKLSQDMWGAFLGDFSGAGTLDPLAWETAGNPPVPLPPNASYNGPWIRSFEIAAVVPDLFDITYYSIDPQFYQNFVERSSTNIFNTGVKPRPDLGYHTGSPLFEKMNVYQQITQFSNRYDPKAIYIIRDPQQLLTAWAPEQLGAEFSYDFPRSVFGKCPGSFKNEGRGIPGGCVYGGRVGYSVKIVSEDYLMDSEAGTGGGSIVGPILNPPPESFP